MPVTANAGPRVAGYCRHLSVLGKSSAVYNLGSMAVNLVVDAAQLRPALQRLYMVGNGNSIGDQNGKGICCTVQTIRQRWSAAGVP